MRWPTLLLMALMVCRWSNEWLKSGNQKIFGKEVQEQVFDTFDTSSSRSVKFIDSLNLTLDLIKILVLKTFFWFLNSQRLKETLAEIVKFDKKI